MIDTDGYAGREAVVEMLTDAQRRRNLCARVVATVERSRSEGADPASRDERRDDGHGDGTSGEPFLRAAEARGIPVIHVRVGARSYLEELRRLVEIFREEAPDVVHTHGYRPDVLGGLAAGRAGVPKVSTVHGFVGGGLRNRLYEAIQRLGYRWFDAVVAVSGSVRARLRSAGVPDDRIHVVRNAWVPGGEFLSREAARDRLEIAADEFAVGWVGRLSREKGPDVLLASLPHLGRPGASVSFLGDGPERGALERTAEEMETSHRVRWHGHVERAARLLPAFDVLVSSSRSEGTPIVLLEAMAAGIPLVAAEVGGVGELLSGREARLVPPERPEALARALEEIRTDPDEASERAAAAARLLRDELGPERWVERYTDVYREVSGDGPVGAP